MKIFLILFILSLITFKNTLAKDEIYDSNFYIIDINSTNISEEKTKNIESIKILSILKILDKILTKDNLILLKKKIILKKEINYLIKNIIIEDEFISLNRYSAKVKISFDKKKIINLLRKNRINYSDLESRKLLFVASVNNNLLKEGLTPNNNFYKKIFIKNKDLLNFTYPDLSPNDRFILPYTKIENLDLISLKKFSEKYKVENIIVLKTYEDSFQENTDINIFSLSSNMIEYSTKFSSSDDDSNFLFEDSLILIINEWWKKKNIINNSNVNKRICTINNSNIHELKFIISKINQISQIKSLKLLSIDLGQNLYELIFYGDLMNLSLKLIKDNILDQFLSKNECILSLKN